jgi:hypothetical protein
MESVYSRVFGCPTAISAKGTGTPRPKNYCPVSRRRQERKALKLARVLAALDDEARDVRRWRPRRAHRAALGTARY